MVERLDLWAGSVFGDSNFKSMGKRASGSSVGVYTELFPAGNRTHNLPSSSGNGTNKLRSRGHWAGQISWWPN